MTDINKPQIIRADEVAMEVCKVLEIRSDRVRRVVLDLEAQEPIRVFVEMIGDERFLDIQWTLDGAKVEFSDKK